MKNYAMIKVMPATYIAIGPFETIIFLHISRIEQKIIFDIYTITS